MSQAQLDRVEKLAEQNRRLIEKQVAITGKLIAELERLVNHITKR